MARIVAVANLKGGCGKSTIAVNLAAELAGPRRRIVLVDADTQGTASRWLEQGDMLLRGEPLPLESPRAAERWITRVLGLDADVIVIDCPPHIGAATEAAVGIADLVAVPVSASGADLMATTEALELITRARARRQDGGPLCLLVPSRIDRRTRPGREIEAALKGFREPVGPAVGQRTAFVDAFSAGEAINTYAPRSKAHAEIKALAGAVARRLRHGKA